MQKFVFKLQPLLNLKKQIEDQIKNELGKAIQKLEYEKNRLQRLENKREDLINLMNKESQKGITVIKLKEYSDFLSYLKGKITAQKENVKYAEKTVDKYREQLIKAVQEREMLDKLKDNKHVEYLKEINREDQKNNDELVSYNFNRNS